LLEEGKAGKRFKIHTPSPDGTQLSRFGLGFRSVRVGFVFRNRVGLVHVDVVRDLATSWLLEDCHLDLL
jgi:hypothetical protein